MSLIKIKGLKKFYKVDDNKTIKALNGINLDIKENTTLGVVGESGCGKSTLAKVLMQIEDITDGDIFFDNEKMSAISLSKVREFIQMIFQDPYSSLNPRKKIWKLIAEPLFINTKLSKQECYKKAVELMKRVGLREEFADRYPHMVSGGQRQRIGIARALILKPKVIICDEPVSALDVSIQAQVLNLFLELQSEYNLTYIFITHDLHVVGHIADEIVVMYLGKIVEHGPREEILNNPKHPYTKILLESTPSISQDKNETCITGEIPSPLSPPSGCYFHTRCPIATDECKKNIPELQDINKSKVACHMAANSN